MSFKKFSSEHDAPSKDNFTANSKDSPFTGQPVTQPGTPLAKGVLVAAAPADKPATGEAISPKSDAPTAEAASES